VNAGTDSLHAGVDRKTIQPSFPGARIQKKFVFLVLQAGNTGYCNLQKEAKK
jgi:hypothetical protein